MPLDEALEGVGCHPRARAESTQTSSRAAHAARRASMLFTPSAILLSRQGPPIVRIRPRLRNVTQQFRGRSRLSRSSAPRGDFTTPGRGASSPEDEPVSPRRLHGRGDCTETTRNDCEFAVGGPIRPWKAFRSLGERYVHEFLRAPAPIPAARRSMRRARGSLRFSPGANIPIPFADTGANARIDPVSRLRHRDGRC